MAIPLKNRASIVLAVLFAGQCTTVTTISASEWLLCRDKAGQYTVRDAQCLPNETVVPNNKQAEEIQNRRPTDPVPAPALTDKHQTPTRKGNFQVIPAPPTVAIVAPHVEESHKAVKSTQTSKNGIINVNDKTFDYKVLQSELPVLVDFYTTWCPSCKQLALTLEEIAPEMVGRVSIARVDVEESPITGERYQINKLPTIILFKNGKASWTLYGAASKKVILARIQRP